MVLCSLVLTVPMRNGNFNSEPILREFFIVLTVPMRNGNYGYCVYWQARKWVLTVPMRNGNVQLQFDIVLELVGSYRTYEEWKLY